MKGKVEEMNTDNHNQTDENDLNSSNNTKHSKPNNKNKKKQENHGKISNQDELIKQRKQDRNSYCN